MRALFLLLAVTIPGLAVNYSGKWAIASPAGRGGRGGSPTIVVMNHVGSEVTGTVSAQFDAGTGSPVNTEIIDGRVENDMLTFYVWSGTDQPVKVVYRGTLASSGDEISFTITRANGPQQATAKRSK